MTISADTMLVEALKRYPDDVERRHAFLIGADWAFEAAKSPLATQIGALAVEVGVFDDGYKPENAQRRGFTEAQNGARRGVVQLCDLLRERALDAQRTHLTAVGSASEYRPPTIQRVVGDVAEIIWRKARG